MKVLVIFIKYNRGGGAQVSGECTGFLFNFLYMFYCKSSVLLSDECRLE